MKRVSLKIAPVVAIALAVAACSSGGESGSNSAAAENPRTAKFKAIGKANKAIGEEFKKDSPSLETVRTNAAALAQLAGELPGWFPAGSGPESGIETEALPAIWQKPEEFKKAAAAFDARAKALQAATAGTDMAAIGAAAKEVGPACKGCHDQFRQKK